VADAPAQKSSHDDPFRRLVESVKDYAIFMLDPSGRVTTWNAGAERIKGYSTQEIIGEHFSKFYPAEAIKGNWPQEELERAAREGRFEDEGWRVRKDGSRFWANVVITAVRDAQGRLHGFAKVTRDLTERRKQEQSLRESEERFRLLVQSVKEYAIFMLDPQGRVMSWNPGAERIKGYKADEIIGQHFSVFYPPEARAKKWPEQELAMAREHGHFEDEGPRARKNGSTFWATVVLTPIYDPQGVLRGYAKVTRDLTDMKRIEALEKAERQTNEFLAMLAHELRNPLAPIRNALHLLARKPTEDATELWAREVLQRQTTQMVRLVDDLLDVSRLTRSTVVLDRKRVDVRAAVSAAVDGSRQWMDARHHELRVALPDERLEVLGDEVRLVQILQNLLHNAAKYTPERGRIEISAMREGEEVVLSVKDNGVGMSAEMLRSAFEPLRQERQTLDRPQGGLGVGLTLVQRLVALHEGKVEAKSAGLDQGSEFIVRLPLHRGELRASAQRQQGEQENTAPRRRVLVIDDNSDAAHALRFLLEQDGHDVRVETEGVSGLEQAREFRPDFLLLDIGLPKMSGYDIARSVRSDPQLSGVRIVAVTGYGEVYDRARSAEAGFDHHLVKPVEYSALQELLRAYA
jgi:PAS domain S-box-containing protein